MSNRQVTWIAAAVLLLALANARNVAAQSHAPESPTTHMPPSDVPGAGAVLPVDQDAEQRGAAIVFLRAQELPAAIAAGLVDALHAQLSGTDTRLHWVDLSGASTDLRAALEQGKPLAAIHHAAGVFWLDATGASDWLLYLMDAAAERVLVRRMEGATASPSAAIEAVALIVRESSAALAAGRPIAMDTVAAAAAPPPAVRQAPEPAPDASPITPIAPTAPATPAPATTDAAADSTHGPMRVALAYSGGPFADDVMWQHGLSLQLGLITAGGWMATLSYTLLPTVDARVDEVAIVLHQRPLRLALGHRWALGSLLRLDAEATGVLDVATRTTQPTPDTFMAADDRTVVWLGTGAHVRLSLLPQPHVELFVSVGIEVFFNRFDYVTRIDGRDVVLLSPWTMGPLAQLGVAFAP